VQVLPKSFLQHTPHWKPKPNVSPGGLTKLLQGGSWHKLDSQMATAADEAWSSRDVWGAVLLALFFATTIVLAVFLGLQIKKVKQLRHSKPEPGHKSEPGQDGLGPEPVDSH
jgi:preprotein translocase subunit SecG